MTLIPLTLPTFTSTLSLTDIFRLEQLVREKFGASWESTKTYVSEDVTICQVKDVPPLTWCLTSSQLGGTWLMYADDIGELWTSWCVSLNKVMMIPVTKFSAVINEAIIINSSFLPTPTNQELHKLIINSYYRGSNA